VQAEGRETPQLNPFAFPSETKGRFTLLILAALALALNLGFILLSLTGSGQREMEEILSILEEERARGGDGAMAGFKVFDKSGPELQEMSDRWTLFFRQQLAKRLTKLLIPVGFMLTLAVVALLVYRRHPERVRRRHGTRRLSRQEAPRVVAGIETLCSRQGLAPPRLEVRPGIAQGHAFGLPGREVLLLHGEPGTLERSWGESLQAIALHELGHMANGDTQEREKARAVWVVFSALLTGMGFLFFLHAGVVPGRILIVQFAAVFVLVWMIRAGLVRIREFYADWRAASWGAGAALEKVLALPEGEAGWWERTRWWWRAWERWGGSPGWDRAGRVGTWLWEKWRQLWRVHPSFTARREVLRDPSRLFAISADLPFLTGLLLTLVLVSVFRLVGELLLMAVGISGLISAAVLSLAAGLAPGAQRDIAIASTAAINILVPFLTVTGFLFFLSFLLTRTLGVQVQRQAIAHLAGERLSRWGYARLLRPALLLALGMEAGFWLTPFSPFVPRAALGWIALPVWLIGFTLFAWLWLAYTHGMSRLLLGTHAGRDNPRLRRGLVTASAAGLLTILFWPAAFARLAVTATLLLSPGLQLPEGVEPRQAFVYVFLMTTMMLLIFAAVIFALWTGGSLLAVWLTALRKQQRCPTCNEEAPFQIVLGRECRGCERELSPWAFVQPGAVRVGEGQ
jgi:Zn-dependent protease with chaperone function